jgi:outer membrane protein
MRIMKLKKPRIVTMIEKTFLKILAGWILPVWVCFILAGVDSVYAQNSVTTRGDWQFKSRLVLSGNSDESEPVGFKAYSGLAIEAGVKRQLGRILAAEISLRTESREIDRERTPDPAERLGSIEMAPVTVTMQYCPSSSGRFHPYFGVGANLTLTWEKSGVLDSLDVAPQVGPAIQLGFDYNLNEKAAINADLRWNTLNPEIKLAGERFAKLKINPIALGVGVGFRF